IRHLPEIVLFSDLRAHFAECLLFESKIRFDITMRCLSALVTEPQCYHCDVNSRLEKMHSTCVSNQMRSDMFFSKTWASCHTSLNSMLKNVVNAVSAQGHAASIGEGCRCVISWVGIQFLKPCSQSAACRGPQRNRSLLSSLALELHKGLGSKVNLSLLKASHLRHTGTGVESVSSNA